MSCKIIRDSISNEIIEVRADNGSPSLLYQDIVKDIGDKENAYKEYNQIISEISDNTNLDVNGEPYYIKNEIRFNVTSIIRQELKELTEQLRDNGTLTNKDFNCK